MDSIRDRNRSLDAMIAKGEILESLPLFYDASCSFTEVKDGARRKSRSAQHDHLSAFFATLSAFNSATLHSQAAENDVTLSEWTFDMVGPEGVPILWKEIIVRHWRDGNVIEEKYYNATA